MNKKKGWHGKAAEPTFLYNKNNNIIYEYSMLLYYQNSTQQMKKDEVCVFVAVNLLRKHV